MTAILLSALAALGGGLVMEVTGFGAGMVAMMALPIFYSLTESAAIAYMILCALIIRFSTAVDQALIQKGFGVFRLCLYYLFLQKDDPPHKKSLARSILCIAFSAVFDSCFSIGGPLLVVCFMARTDSTKPTWAPSRRSSSSTTPTAPSSGSSTASCSRPTCRPSWPAAWPSCWGAPSPRNWQPTGWPDGAQAHLHHDRRQRRVESGQIALPNRVFCGIMTPKEPKRREST